MSLFGKLLLFVNLLAAGGFVYLAVDNWQHRQNTAAIILRHRLELTGIPFQSETMPAEEEAEVPFKPEIVGSANIETVSKKFLGKYFEIAGTPPSRLGGTEVVNSQLAEVARVKQKVQQLVEAAGDNKAIVAAEFLEPLSETLDERYAIFKLRQENKGDKLAEQLMDRFDDVLQQSKTKEEVERRMKLDHLLTQLDTSEVWQKRTALIIGLKRYKNALAAQTTRFDRMVVQLQRLMEQDQNAYSQSIRILERQAIDRTQKLIDSINRLKTTQDQAARDAEALASITTEVNTLKTSFASIKAKVDDLLVKQTAAEKKLFEYQRMVGATLVDLFDLEKRLADLELQASRGAKP